MACSSFTTAILRSPSIWAYRAALTSSATSSVMGGMASAGFSAGRSDWPETPSPPGTGAATAAGTGSPAGSDKSAARSISSTERGFSEEPAGTAAMPAVSGSSPSSTAAGPSGFCCTGTGTGVSTTFSTTTVRAVRLKETPTISSRTNASAPSVQQAMPNARSRAFFSGGRDSLIRHPRHPSGQACRRTPELLHSQLPHPGKGKEGPS